MNENAARYLLVGGGPATAAAAEAIREADPEGRIVLFCAEGHPPYDRVPLSKTYLLDDGWKTDDPHSKADDFYPDNRIEVRTNSRVTRIDRAARTATLAGGAAWAYEKLLLATGATPLSLNVPGHDRRNVFLLRTVEDAEAIRAAIRRGGRGVCVGAGNIGIEVAAAATERGVEMTVIERADRPWSRFAGPRLGNFLRRAFEERGVRFVVGEEVTGLAGGDAVTGVTVGDGREIPADFVVVGVGVALNLDLATAAGLDADPKQGVRVSEFLQTSDPHIWAAGDIACFHDRAMDRTWHIEHHMNAKWQGQAAGRILAGRKEPYDRVPYFWSDVFDLHLCLRGDVTRPGDENAILHGDLADAEFTELQHDDAGVLRGATIVSHDEEKMDAISDVVEALIRARVNVRAREADIARPGFDLASLR